MSTFWTADLHFGHENISTYCPGRQLLGSTVGEMNVGLIEGWNLVVSPDDTVNIVGDLCMGKISTTLPLVEMLNGHKRLIAGNHDRWFGTMGADPSTKKGRSFARWSAAYEEVGLELVTDGWLDMEIGGHEVRVCHFPYDGDSHGEDRYVDERPPNDGKILLCGHVHDAWRVKDRQINVGVDVWGYAPVEEADIVALIEQIK